MSRKATGEDRRSPAKSNRESCGAKFDLQGVKTSRDYSHISERAKGASGTREEEEAKSLLSVKASQGPACPSFVRRRAKQRLERISQRRLRRQETTAADDDGNGAQVERCLPQYRNARCHADDRASGKKRERGTRRARECWRE